MTVSSVGIEEVRAAVNVALDELRESLRKVNHEVSIRKLLCICSIIASIQKIANGSSMARYLDLVKPRACIRRVPWPRYHLHFS